MKKMDRKNWDSIKNIESISGKFKDGREYRIFKDPVTGCIEMLLDHKDLQEQNQHDYRPYIEVMGFSYPE